MLCLVSRPLLDSNWQYVPVGGVTAMSVGIFNVECGGILVCIVLWMLYPAACSYAFMGMVAL